MSCCSMHPRKSTRPGSCGASRHVASSIFLPAMFPCLTRPLVQPDFCSIQGKSHMPVCVWKTCVEMTAHATPDRKELCRCLHTGPVPSSMHTNTRDRFYTPKCGSSHSHHHRSHASRSEKKKLYRLVVLLSHVLHIMLLLELFATLPGSKGRMASD